MFDPNWDSEASEEYQPEPLLEHNAKRFVLFPIKYSSFWNLYKNCQAKFWSAVEAELDEPIEMNRQVSLVIMALSLLAINDDSLSESAVSQISSDIQSPEARCFFGFQIMQRTIHTEALTMALDRLTSEIDRDDMVSSVASSTIY
jgi:ribonucleotide reductase beta subunit family protein with ferritin-like domain